MELNSAEVLGFIGVFLLAIAAACRMAYLNRVEQNVDTEYPIDHSSPFQDSYSGYRLAGELFGRLDTELQFGALSMYSETERFVFQWSFKARGKLYVLEFNLDRAALEESYEGVEGIANRISRRWKTEHSRRIETGEIA